VQHQVPVLDHTSGDEAALIAVLRELEADEA
jgi:hypothetical protein